MKNSNLAPVLKAFPLSKIATVLKELSLSKTLISVILVVLFLSFPKVGFFPMGGENFRLVNNIVFPLCHANIFHLLCNLYCLWLMRKPYYILYGIVISFLCSLLPCPVLAFDFSLFTFHFESLPIMGCSGVLFAIIGIKWGRVAQWKQMWSRTWLFFLVTMFIPNVAFLFHLYCITVGYAYGYVSSTYALWRKTRMFL